MYPEFEDCEHVLSELYDYGIEQDIPVVQVDDEIRQAYWQHRRLYTRLEQYDGWKHEIRLHKLNMHVLEDHVKSELEKIVQEREKRS